MRIELTEADLRIGAITAEGVLPAIDVEVGIEPRTGGAAWKLSRFNVGGGHDAAATRSDDLAQQATSELRGLVLFLSRTFVAPIKEIGCAFALIQVDRGLLGQRRHAQATARLRNPGIIPDALALQLYDAKEALDEIQVGRWSLFRDGLAEFGDVLGPGKVGVTYDRLTERATVVLERNGTRIPARLLGSGVQQLVALLGQVLMSGARVVAIEEPELNLRVSLLRHGPDGPITTRLPALADAAD